jgi:hypothetical protein
VTYDRTAHYVEGGSNTLQIILFQDGRIQFGYRGITALRTGTITGLTPGPNTPFQQVDFTATPALSVPANTSVYEYFTTTNQFDLDGGFVIFTPQPGGGYNVRTIKTPPPGNQSLISGGAATTPVAAQAALTSAQLANAEVEIRSSLDPKFRGMTNTGPRGMFSLNGVPRGAIQVTVRRKGEVIGTGGAVLDVLQPSAKRGLNVQIARPNPSRKALAQ